MARTHLSACPLALALACTFDSSGLQSAGPPDSATGTSASSSSSSGPALTTTQDPTTGTSTGGSSTTAVDPTPGSSSSSTTAPPPPNCGDGVLDPDEACDGAELGRQTCADLGFLGGTLACTAGCALDTSACLSCGNGVLDPGEDCEGADLGGKTCEDLQLFSGALACSPECTFDTAGCLDMPANWYDPAFHKRRKLTIAAADVKGDLADFPVALELTDPALLTSLTPADKLVFTTLDGMTVLAHDLQLDAKDLLVIWVNLPVLDATNGAVFYVYYGNPDVSGTADPAATWSPNFTSVWHLDEAVIDEQFTGMHADATGKGHTGTQKGNVIVDSCILGPCQEFGPDDFIDVAKANEFKLGDAFFTVAAWVKTSQQDARALFAKSNPMMTEPEQVIVGIGAAPGKLGVQQPGLVADGKTAIADDQWHHVAWVQTKDADMKKERWRLYVDGAIDHEVIIGDVKPTKDAYPFRIGGPTPDSAFPANFLGRLDEVQISNTTRSPDWMFTAHRNQRDPAAFTAVGPEESY